MTSWDEPPDAIAPWNMPGFDEDEPFYRDDVLPQTIANTPHVATRLNDEQLVISTVLDQPHAWDAIRHLRPSDFDMKPLADAWTAISQAIRSRTPVTPQH